MKSYKSGEQSQIADILTLWNKRYKILMEIQF